MRYPAGGSGWQDQTDAYLDTCLRRESTARVKELAHVLGRSRSYLHRVFTETLGTTPSFYLRRFEVLAAGELLRDSELKETRVAYKAGFGTRRTLFRAFQKTLGMTPSAYRAMAHADSGGPNVTTSPIPKWAKTEVSGVQNSPGMPKGKAPERSLRAPAARQGRLKREREDR